MAEAFLLSSARTPTWALDDAPHPDVMAATAAVQALTARPDVVESLDAVILGAAGGAPAGPRGPAWAAAIAAGLPLDVSAHAVDHGDASGLQAVASAALAVASGHRDLVLAVAATRPEALAAPSSDPVAWRTADLDRDAVLDLLQRRHDLDPDQAAAILDQAGTRTRLGDDDLRPAATLVPSPVAGAAAVLVASEAFCARRELTTRARIVAQATAGGEPAWWPQAPAHAVARLLEAASLDLGELAGLDLCQSSAWAVLAQARVLDLDPRELGPAGGALGRGHLGVAEGIRQLHDLLDFLEDSDGRLGIVSSGGPGGQALALLLDRARWA